MSSSAVGLRWCWWIDTTRVGPPMRAPASFLPDVPRLRRQVGRAGPAAGEHHHELTVRVADDGAGGTGHEVCGLIRLSTSEGEDEWLAKGAELAERRSPGVVTAIEPDEAVSLFHRSPRCEAPCSTLAPVNRWQASDRSNREGNLDWGLRRVEGEVISLLLDGDRALGVETDTGSVAAGSVAIAGGAWSSGFAAQLRTNLPISPMKGQIIHLTMPGAETGRWPIVQPVFSHYLVPWPGGRVACGGTLEAKAGFDTSATAGGVFELLREGLRTAPGLASAMVSEVRVGLRPASKDDRPVLGRLDGWSNVYVATGHGTEGLLLGSLHGLTCGRDHRVRRSSRGRSPACLRHGSPTDSAALSTESKACSQQIIIGSLRSWKLALSDEQGTGRRLRSWEVRGSGRPRRERRIVHCRDGRRSQPPRRCAAVRTW